MAKPTQKLRPFDPNRTKPVPSNPKMMLDHEGMPAEDDDRPDQQRMLPPSKREQPTMNFCKGGKVINTRRM